MIVYHGFYPVDDVVRRKPTIGATNREFHHLAMGLLLPDERDDTDLAQLLASVALPNTGFVFTCTGPDHVRMMPLNHPFLTKVNDRGQPDPSGNHMVVYCIVMSPSGWQYNDQPDDANKSIIQDSVAKNAPWQGRLLGGVTFVGFGAGLDLQLEDLLGQRSELLLPLSSISSSQCFASCSAVGLVTITNSNNLLPSTHQALGTATPSQRLTT